MDSFYKESVQTLRQSSERFHFIPQACYRYLGMRGNGVSQHAFKEEKG